MNPNHPTQDLDNPAPLDFCLRLARAHAQMLRRLDNRLGTLHGIGFGDFQLLYHLDRAPAGRLRRVDLAERLGLTASGVTRTLLPLEKIGLVLRQSDPRDARVSYTALTPAGAAMLRDALSVAQQISADLLKAESAEQLDALAQVLGQIAGMNLSNT